MGWLFGWNTRRQLVEHLTSGNGVKTLKRCFRGNDMWAVQETAEGVVFACLYLLRGNPRVTDDPCNWGYKDIDETMGPNRLDFPVAWLDLLSPCVSEYSVNWRAAVRERGEKLKRVVIGSKWDSGKKRYTVTRRRSPSSLVVKDEEGMLWRISPHRLINYDEVTL